MFWVVAVYSGLSISHMFEVSIKSVAMGQGLILKLIEEKVIAMIDV